MVERYRDGTVISIAAVAAWEKGHLVKILPGKTFRLPVPDTRRTADPTARAAGPRSVTRRYNADFDGTR